MNLNSLHIEKIKDINEDFNKCVLNSKLIPEVFIYFYIN